MVTVTATEASTHDDYRAALVNASPTDAVYTDCFDGGWPSAPHRVLRNATLAAWEAAGRPPRPQRPGEGDVVATDSYGRQFLRYDDMVPLREVRGHVHDMALYAGQSVGLVRDTSSGGDIVRRLAEQAATALASATGA